MNYYDQNSKQFIKSTFKLDLSDFYTRFEKHLKPNAKILDLGCGPGRDLKYFSKQYTAVGLEPSSILAEYARTHSNCIVHETTIQEFKSEEKFDGVWACASLLHLRKSELPSVFKILSNLLLKNGIIYCSFKYGDFEGERNGRFFSDLNEKGLKEMINDTDLEAIDQWLTGDVRVGRENEKWLNAILTIKP